VAEACPECDVVDELGRHDPLCQRALRLGLPRLAEGEMPVFEEPTDEPDFDVEPLPWLPDGDEEDLTVADINQAASRTPSSSGPWMAYGPCDTAIVQFVLFEDELSALRYAVARRMQVCCAAYGVPLSKLAEDASDGDDEPSEPAVPADEPLFPTFQQEGDAP
jgi:hypothetical protein